MTYTAKDLAEANPVVDYKPESRDLIRLGLMSATPQGKSGADNVSAYKWFSLAAVMGATIARHYREKLCGEMSTQQKERAIKDAKDWLTA